MGNDRRVHSYIWHDHIRLIKGTINKDVPLDIFVAQNPDIIARLVAESIAQQIERHPNPKHVIQKVIDFAMQFDVKGIKVSIYSRLGGRRGPGVGHHYYGGYIPAKAEADCGFAKFHTISGRKTIQVWIYTGEIPPSFAGRGRRGSSPKKEKRPKATPGTPPKPSIIPTKPKSEEEGNILA